MKSSAPGMTDTERAVLPHLRHIEVKRTQGCSCPAHSWAPCGGQYEGRFDPACAHHRLLRVTGGHYPSSCPQH